MPKKYTVTETWIVNEASPVESTSAEQTYERLPRVSGSLPVLDVPIDFRESSHFLDEVIVRDFAAHLSGASRVLDIGTGDGWPLLRIARFFTEAVGIDAAQRRVETAQAHAARLNLTNVTIAKMDGMQLQFEDNSFDGVMAASAVEQTPNPLLVLQEVFRVLRPGGKFRVYFESYDNVEKGFTEQVFVTETADSLGYHYTIRHGRPPWERSYLVKFAVTPEMQEEFRRLRDLLQRLGSNPAQAREIGQQFLERNRAHVTGSSWFELEHFTSLTMKATLEEIGFENVRVSYSAATLAKSVWPRIQNSGLSDQQMQELCQGLADMAVNLDAPVGRGEPLVATKPK